MKNINAAEQEISRKLVQNPDDCDARLRRAMIRRDAGELDSALDDARMAFQYARNSFYEKDAVSLMARILGDQGLSIDEADWRIEAMLGEAASTRDALRYDVVQGGAWKGYLEYGQCRDSPYKENGLWFVVIRGMPSSEDHTFLVSEQFARARVFHEWGPDKNKWRDAGHKALVGAWCSRYQKLWRNVPVLEHTLSDGTRVKYGYCRRQPRNPERHLWFVAMDHSYHSCFVVDHCFATPAGIDRMGQDRLKWWLVCWHDLDERDVQWDKLQTGTLDGGLVRNHSSFPLNFPALPFTLEEAERRVSQYERVLPKVIKHSNMTVDEWHSQRIDRQRAQMQYWEEQNGIDIFPY